MCMEGATAKPWAVNILHVNVIQFLVKHLVFFFFLPDFTKIKTLVRNVAINIVPQNVKRTL